MRRSLGFCALLAVASAAPGAEVSNAARDLAATCATCHGIDGRALGGIEPLAGTSARRLVEQMAAYRSGAKAGTLMQQIARGYSDAQVALIGAYYAALPKPN